jgi:hypothetical protein
VGDRNEGGVRIFSEASVVALEDAINTWLVDETLDGSSKRKTILMMTPIIVSGGAFILAVYFE